MFSLVSSRKQKVFQIALKMKFIYTVFSHPILSPVLGKGKITHSLQSVFDPKNLAQLESP